LWNLYSGAIHEGESMRVFPLSNWTERDIWDYIVQENIKVVPLYYAKERLVVNRNGMLIPADDTVHLKQGEVPEKMWVRFRTLGCTHTGAVAHQQRWSRLAGWCPRRSASVQHESSIMARTPWKSGKVF
jgi:sulfate adenylyltransferase subunit 2